MVKTSRGILAEIQRQREFSSVPLLIGSSGNGLTPCSTMGNRISENIPTVLAISLKANVALAATAWLNTSHWWVTVGKPAPELLLQASPGKDWRRSLELSLSVKGMNWTGDGFAWSLHVCSLLNVSLTVIQIKRRCFTLHCLTKLYVNSLRLYKMLAPYVLNTTLYAVLMHTKSCK